MQGHAERTHLGESTSIVGGGTAQADSLVSPCRRGSLWGLGRKPHLETGKQATLLLQPNSASATHSQ
jgi:hypothetical protein